MIDKKKGFTLVELLIVVAIIGILVVIAIVAINPVRVIRDSRDTKARTESNQVKTALQLYYNDNRDYPTKAEFAGTCTGSCVNFTPTYMKKMPSSVDTSRYDTDGSSYTLWTFINYESSDDQDSHTKCSSGTAPAIGGEGKYWVCPD